MAARRRNYLWTLALLSLLGGCAGDDNPYHLPPMFAGSVRLDIPLSDPNGVPIGTRVIANANGVRVWLVESGQAVDSALTEGAGVYVVKGKQGHTYRTQAGIRPALVDSSEAITADRAIGYYPDTLRLGRVGDLAGSPNPFSVQVALRLGLAADTRVDIGVYDISARRVRVLASRTFPAGLHMLVWDGKDDSANTVSDGIYWVLLQTASETRAELVIKQP